MFKRLGASTEGAIGPEIDESEDTGLNFPRLQQNPASAFRVHRFRLLTADIGAWEKLIDERGDSKLFLLGLVVISEGKKKRQSKSFFRIKRRRRRKNSPTSISYRVKFDYF